MANEEVIGSRKTAIVLVIVVGCFAMLWPRILSPLVLGQPREDLKPNQFDRDSGCCEVIFETEVAVLELLNEVCSSLIGADGKLSPIKASECRKAVNATCGLDIAAFLKRSENVGKTTKTILEVMKTSNSSCLREHFGVPIWSLSAHLPINFQLLQNDKVKQERPTRGAGAGTHPALRERGRAIPAGDPIPPSRATVSLPPHVRVRSPLSEYFTPQPPPIPGMRPPLGSAGGPMPAPKSAMNVMMPIYTICIIVFFVYTLSKLLFKRGSASPYESVNPDPQFRRRVFRDDSRATPETKLGEQELELLRARLAETERVMQRIMGQLAKRNEGIYDSWHGSSCDVTPHDAQIYFGLPSFVVSAISGLVAEVRQQMDASYNDNMQRTQDVQDEQARPHTNGTIKSDHSSRARDSVTPPSDQVHSKQDLNQKVSELNHSNTEDKTENDIDQVITKTELSVLTHLPNLVEECIEGIHPKFKIDKPTESIDKEDNIKEDKQELAYKEEINTELNNKHDEAMGNGKVISEGTTDFNEGKEWISNNNEDEEKALDDEFDKLVDLNTDDNAVPDDWLMENEEPKPAINVLSSALNDSRDASAEDDEKSDEHLDEKSSVKVLGMETTAHSADGSAWPKAEAAPVKPAPTPHLPAEEVASIFLETDIPQQTRVLVSEFEDHADRTTSTHSPPAEEVASIFLETDIPQQTRVLVSEFEDHADRTTSTHSPLVVSGKMTLSLIQDSPRETPERDPDSTVDDYTTASAVTQPAEGNIENITGEDEEGEGPAKEEILDEDVLEEEEGDLDEDEGVLDEEEGLLEEGEGDLEQEGVLEEQDRLEGQASVLEKQEGIVEKEGDVEEEGDIIEEGEDEEVLEEEIEIEYIEEEEEENI